MGLDELSLPLLVLAAIAVVQRALALRRVDRADASPWWLAIAVVVGGGALAWVSLPDLAGIVAFALVALLLAAPPRLLHAAQGALRRGSVRRSRALATAATLLHPSVAFRDHARFLELLAALRQGEATTAALTAFSKRYPETGELLTVVAAHVAGDTAAVLRYLGPPADAQNDAQTDTQPDTKKQAQLLARGLGVPYLRAVAIETDDGRTIAAAIREIVAHDPTFGEPEVLALVAVFLPALLGDPATTAGHAALLRAYLGPGEATSAQALALTRAGDRPAGLALLDRAVAGEPGGAGRRRRALPRTAKQHLAAYRRIIGACADRPPTADRGLDEFLGLLRRRAPELAELAALEGRGADRLPLTWGLAGLLAAVYLGVALTGDPLDPEHLYAWGALFTEPGWRDEAWRLLTSTLLHAGPLHLFFNLFALRFFGRFVEPLFGRGRMAAVYLSAGLLAAVAVALLGDPAEPRLLVGASGAILGLGGAILAAALRRPSLRRSPRGQAEIRGLLVLFALQVVFDTLTPSVSQTAHIAGALTGFFAGLLLTPPSPAGAKATASPA